MTVILLLVCSISSHSSLLSTFLMNVSLVWVSSFETLDNNECSKAFFLGWIKYGFFLFSFIESQLTIEVKTRENLALKVPPHTICNGKQIKGQGKYIYVVSASALQKCLPSKRYRVNTKITKFIDSVKLLNRYTTIQYNISTQRKCFNLSNIVVNYM